MTLKYTPIYKRIQFAQKGERFVSPEDPISVTRQEAPERVTIRNTGYYDDSGYFHSSDGNVYTKEVPGISELVVTGYNRSLSPFSGESRLRNAQLANNIDQQKANYYFQSPSPLDLIRGLYYTVRGRRSTNPEDYDGLITGTADLPFDFNRKGMAKAIFQKAIDSGRDLKQVFSSMPASAQKEILEDSNLFRQISTLGGGNQGERVFYGSGPSISGMKPKKGMPFEGEAEYVTPVSEQQARIDDIVEFNRRNQSRGISEQELPDVSQPEAPRTVETYWDRIARQAENTPTEQVTPTRKSTTSRKPRKTKAQINEERAAAAKEVAEKARQEAFGKASRQYAALSDDEVMSSYREMAKSGKVDTPEYEAILQEGQARKMLDDNGRPISKSNGQKPSDSSVEEPSTGTQEAANNTTKKTDNKKGWKEKLKKPLSSGLQLIWETKNHNFNNWYQTRNAGRLLGAGLLGGQRIASGIGNVGPALWYGVGNSNKNDSTQVQTKTASNNQQITEQGDTAVAGDVKPNEQPVQVKKHQSFKDIMDQF